MNQAPIATPRELLEWVASLHNPTVQIHNFGKAAYHTLNLQTLTKDLPTHPDLPTWWKGKNMTPHLAKTIALTIIGLKPPENIKAALTFLVM